MPLFPGWEYPRGGSRCDPCPSGGPDPRPCSTCRPGLEKVFRTRPCWWHGVPVVRGRGERESESQEKGRSPILADERQGQVRSVPEVVSRLPWWPSLSFYAPSTADWLKFSSPITRCILRLVSFYFRKVHAFFRNDIIVIKSDIYIYYMRHIKCDSFLGNVILFDECAEPRCISVCSVVFVINVRKT